MAVVVVGASSSSVAAPAPAAHVAQAGWRDRLRPRGRDRQRLVPEQRPPRHLGHRGGGGDLRHAHGARTPRARSSPTWPSRSSPTPTSPSGRSPSATASPSTTAPRSTPTRWRRTSRPTGSSALIGAALKNITNVTVDSPTQLTVTTGRAVGRVPELPVPRRPVLDRRTRTARRSRHLRREPDRHRPVQAREPHDQPGAGGGAQPRLLAEGRARATSSPTSTRSRSSRWRRRSSA